QRHPTNMHLSCHRAISVRRELIGMGVSSQKILAAGWGEMRPLVPNASNGNTPQNRRVEIYLRSGSSFAGAPMGSTTSVGVDTEGAPARNFDPTK
ncbi:MAG: OmpA family protein, partial [Phycisphaerales bacterium]|nr:OmpA family protein [Phycisphaerales bacterium]